MPGTEAAPQPNEEVRRYFEQNPGDDTDGVLDFAVLRQQTHDVGMRVRGDLAAVDRVSDTEIRSVPVRSYRPLSLTDPETCFLWIHGGGWMHGDLDVYDGVARAFAIRLGVEVLSIDYGLAPEHPFPFALDQVWTVVKEIAQTRSRVVLAGDSSGGNIAAAAALKARDAELPIAAQLLIYPVLESSKATDFKQQFRARYAGFVGQADFGAATADRIEWIWETYVPSEANRTDPLASPSHAASLRGVAPAVILTAEHDILRGEGEAYADRLRADDVAVTVLNFPGEIHGFLQMRGVLTEAITALELAADAVGRYLAPSQHAQQQKTQH